MQLNTCILLMSMGKVVHVVLGSCDCCTCTCMSIPLNSFARVVDNVYVMSEPKIKQAFYDVSIQFINYKYILCKNRRLSVEQVP